jgi:hypothetical protein
LTPQRSRIDRHLELPLFGAIGTWKKIGRPGSTVPNGIPNGGAGAGGAEDCLLLTGHKFKKALKNDDKEYTFEQKLGFKVKSEQGNKEQHWASPRHKFKFGRIISMDCVP